MSHEKVLREAEVAPAKIHDLARLAAVVKGLKALSGEQPRKGKNMEKLNNGIPDIQRRAMAEGLSHLLADTYTLYLKTHNFHWNVTGPHFRTLHLMFEEEYNELALAVDTIAERIRALGHFAPGTYREFSKLSEIREADGVPTAEEMIRQLVEGHETVSRTARKAFPKADVAGDEATADLLTQRLQVHEKTAWMLRSMLERG